MKRRTAHAVEILLDGFGRDAPHPDPLLYREALTVVMRVVFAIHAESRGLSPGGGPGRARPPGVVALYERLAADPGSDTEPRFDAYPRLLGSLHAVCPGGHPETSPLADPTACDRTVHRMLHCLLVSDGQRVDYAALDVEHIGAVYESLLGYRVRREDAAGRLTLEPGDRRRRTGSHYTPRALAESVVERTLEPLFACLGSQPAAADILGLTVCDPAMGSGAFLLAACRQLADRVVTAWTREGRARAIAGEHGDLELHARRLVARRCLCGVDKDPTAVELARMSLWLLTRDDPPPGVFLDHALRHGDSLLGLSLEQIRGFHWEPAPPVAAIAALLDRALAGSRTALARARLVADACVGAFFAATRRRERERRLAVVTAYLAGDRAAGRQLHEFAAAVRDRAPFHWPLEFPGRLGPRCPDPGGSPGERPRGGIDAVVGNPPFLGGKKISTEHGAAYADWLALRPGASKNADLSAHFLRRAAELVGTRGVLGFIATNTIAQGDTRKTGLRALIEAGWTVYDGERSLPWPGAAVVTVSLVHAAIGPPAAHPAITLDGAPAPVIDSFLRPRRERPAARALVANAGNSFNGWYLRGMGFTLTAAERDALIARSAPNRERIAPYLGGGEINTSPTQSYHRYAIDFGEMTLAEAERWPDLLAIVRDRVKPARDRVTRGPHRRYWWRHAEPRPALTAALAALDRCLVNSQVSKHVAFAFQPTGRLFGHTLYVYPLPAYTAFGVLQSQIHAPWARLLASSMKTDLRYAVSDCFATFPFPRADPRAVIDPIERAAEVLHAARAAFMVDAGCGLTRTYDALADPTRADPRVDDLRRLHEALDRSVLDAYGWTDLVVPPYCARTQAERAAAAAFADDVIDRLYALNASRAADEDRLG